MNDFIKIITHARRFKSAVKELGVEQLEEIKIKLQKIIDDRVADEEAAKKENAEKIEKIKKIKKMLAAEGIELNELLEGASEKQITRAPRKKPKYEIWSEEGNITWTGQGRMPNVFKACIEAGETLETFLIDE